MAKSKKPKKPSRRPFGGTMTSRIMFLTDELRKARMEIERLYVERGQLAGEYSRKISDAEIAKRQAIVRARYAIRVQPEGGAAIPFPIQVETMSR